MFETSARVVVSAVVALVGWAEWVKARLHLDSEKERGARQVGAGRGGG